MKHKGFTLIELLVVIVIIGVLATISVATFNTYFAKARTANVQAELKPLIQAIVIARNFEDKTLRQITGSGCSNCAGNCRSGRDLRNITDGDGCFDRWKLSLERIAEASGQDVSVFERDPWGSPYMLDENEGRMQLTVEEMYYFLLGQMVSGIRMMI